MKQNLAKFLNDLRTIFLCEYILFTSRSVIGPGDPAKLDKAVLSILYALLI